MGALARLVRPAGAAVVGFVISVALLGLVFWNADIAEIRTVLSSVAWSTLALVTILLFASVVLGTLRLQALAKDAGSRISFSSTMAAVCMGQLAGAAFFQIIGQLLVRGALLKRHGMSVSASVLVTMYERLMAVGVSVALALAGAIQIFGLFGIDLRHGGGDLVRLLIGLVVVVSVGARFVWGRTLRRVWGGLSLDFFIKLTRSLLLTCAIQLCTMATFVIAAAAFSSDIPLMKVAAASAIVMFATALPISMAGWGVREMTSIFALGAIGVAPATALTVALLIGTLAMATNVVFGFAALAFQKSDRVAVKPVADAHDRSASLLGWTLPIMAATAVFFQLHVPVGSRELNVNLADIVALIGAAIFLAHWIPAWPTWRLARLNLFVLLMSIALLGSFLHGVYAFGWTQWAVVNKITGWGFLLGYGMTGALVVRAGGREGTLLFLKTIVIVAAALVALELAFDIARLGGVSFLGPIVRASGFAGDPNAFAFQVILAMSALFLFVEEGDRWRWFLGLAVVGVWLSGSRSGMIAFAAVFCALGFLNRRMLRGALPMLGLGIVGVMAVAAVFILVPGLFDGTAPGAGADAIVDAVMFREGRPHSTREHIETIIVGFKQFLDSPLVGNGLGFFMETYGRERGIAHPIDSTAVWLLAELGLVGFAAFAVPFAIILVRERRKASAGDRTALVIVLMLVAFAAMSLFYELLYQRMFWMLLGALMASTPSIRTQALAAPREEATAEVRRTRAADVPLAPVLNARKRAL